MSVKNTDELWLHRVCEPRRMHLLHAIADCSDDEGRSFPSVNYLAWKTNLPRSTVIQYMQEFRQLGVLEDVGMRSDIEHHISAHSEKDTKVVCLHLDRLPEKKSWRKKHKGASPAAGLGGGSGSWTTVVQPRAVASPVAGSAIRKNRKEPSQNQVPPIVPAERGLTPRQLVTLSKELNHIYGARVGTGYDAEFEDRALRTACVRLCLPLDLARKAIAESEGRTA